MTERVGGRGRNICGSRSCEVVEFEKALGPKAAYFWLDGEGMTNSYLSIELKRDFDIGVLGPGIDDYTNSPLTAVTFRLVSFSLMTVQR